MTSEEEVNETPTAEEIAAHNEAQALPVDEPTQAPKSLGNTDVSGTSINVPDVVVFGDGDAWKLICKASSKREGWMKSTKAMQIGHGCLVQVTTQQRGLDGTYAVAEALTFVPGVQLRDVKDDDGEVIGRRLTT